MKKDQLNLHHLKKRSIKRRTRKMMLMTNSITLFLTCIVIFFAVNFVIITMGSSYLKYSAHQLANVVQHQIIVNGYTDIKGYLEEINPDVNSLPDHLKFSLSGEQGTPLRFDMNPVQYQFWVNGEVIYDSKKETIGLTADEREFTDKISSHIPMEEIVGITDQEGKIIGEIRVIPNPILLIMIYSLLVIFGVILLIGNSIVTKIITGILSRQVVKPLDTLNNSLYQLAVSETNDNQIEPLTSKNKKPVYEVYLLMNSTNQLITRFNEINHIITAQNNEFEAQNVTLADSRDALSSMNAAYLNRSNNLQNLLNNIGQGFLSINRNLQINPEYSYECERMIKPLQMHSLCSQSVLDTLFLGQPQVEFIEELLRKILSCDYSQQELFLSLLPEEVEKNGCILRIEYKMIHVDEKSDEILVILTDITETRNLESLMLQERNHLNMIVKILLNRDEYGRIIQEYLDFCSGNYHDLTESEYPEILREIHTFKGVFSQYYMNSITDYLNTLESNLSELDFSEATRMLNPDEMKEALEADLAIIKNYVGNDFLHDDETYSIKDNKITEIEYKLKGILPSNEYKKVLPLIQSLRHKSLKNMLCTYCDYTYKLSERLHKSIHPMEIEGDDLFINPRPYQQLIKNMVHLFRNSVDHGIEEPDTRIERGKDEIATISCTLKALPGGFEITVSDDGNGINSEHLIETALQKELLTKEQINQLSLEELYEIIFMDGFTTKENANSVSGRGVGLAALRESVEELNGHIRIETTLHQGTIFTIYVPLIDSSPEYPGTNRLSQNFQSIAKDFYETLGIHAEQFDIRRTNKISLYKNSSLVSIKGSIDAILIFSIDEGLARNMVKSFIMEEVGEEDLSEYIEDVLSEVTNTVLGNSLADFENNGVYLTIGVPATLVNTNAYVKYSDSQIYSINYADERCSVSINFIIIDSEFNNQVDLIETNTQEANNG